MSQTNGDFTAKGGFPRWFHSSFRRWACGCEIFLWRVSQLISQLRNGLLGCEMAHVCRLGVVSQLRNFSQEGVLWLQNCFTGGPSFRNITPFSQDASFGYEMFSQGKPLLAAKFSQENKFLYFCASLVPYDFPPLLLKFLLILIIQKV